jgi:Family of unknown function (DUF6885)
MSVSPPFVDLRRAVPGGRPARDVVKAIFPEAQVAYVEHWDEIADAFDSFEDQRPATCGAYAARYLLGPLGFRRSDGIDTTREDYLAYLAGTVIEADESREVEAVARRVADLGLTDEEAIARYPRNWYGWPLRTSDDDAIAGTSPTGIARAISIGSGGELVTLPVPARAPDHSIVLTADRFDALLDLVEANLAAWRIHPIANLEVDQLLDATSDAYSAETLAGDDPAARIPRERWGVGHFVGIGAIWGSGGRCWALFLDTYKARGFDGYVPMPAESLRRAIMREDGRDGGLLLVMARSALEAATVALADLGLEIRMWGNGSLEPEGWVWELGR